MKKICFISHGHPVANPRMIRSANALAEAGYAVSVVTPRFIGKWAAEDGDLVKKARWTHHPVEFLNGRIARLRWQWVRFRLHAHRHLFRVIPVEAVAARACCYANPELARMALGERADLYIAQQHQALPAAAWAADRAQSRLAFDAEDLQADYSMESGRAIHRWLEDRYLKRCAYVSTMAPPAARWLQDRHNLPKSPIVLRNVPYLAERQGVLPPARRSVRQQVSLYWMGQTIGPHSQAGNVLQAMARISRPIRLVLQGHPDSAYVEGLRRQAQSLGLAGRLEIRPPVPPGEVIRAASEYDIALATQPDHEPFHELSLGNKAFAGMMAGLALMLADTEAYRELVVDAPGFGVIVPSDRPEVLAERLGALLETPGLLLQMKQKSWEWAETRYNWEKESETLLAAVKEVLGTPVPSSPAGSFSSSPAGSGGGSMDSPPAAGGNDGGAAGGNDDKGEVC
ncbi:MAG: glycosyltransferase [Elusimicrobiota bacterium]